jgi:hypothetical protein
MQGRLQVAQSERRLARGDGSYVLAHVTATVAEDGAGRPLGLLWLAHPLGEAYTGS